MPKMDWLRDYLPDSERLNRIEAGFQRMRNSVSIPDMKVRND